MSASNDVVVGVVEYDARRLSEPGEARRRRTRRRRRTLPSLRRSIVPHPHALDVRRVRASSFSRRRRRRLRRRLHHPSPSSSLQSLTLSPSPSLARSRVAFRTSSSHARDSPRVSSSPSSRVVVRRSVLIHHPIPSHPVRFTHDSKNQPIDKNRPRGMGRRGVDTADDAVIMIDRS